MAVFSSFSEFSAASAALSIGYTYPLAAYLNFCLGGIQYPCCPLDGTAEAAVEAEDADAAASAYYNLDNKLRLHTYEICEVEGEGTHFSFFPLSLA